MTVAAEEIAFAKKRVKDLTEERKELTRPLDELKAKLMGKYEPALTTYKAGIAIIEPKILSWSREQQLAREREAQRLAEIARKEKARMDEEAAKVAAKAAADAEALRQQAAAAAAEGNAARAAALESRADAKEEAGAIKAAEITTVAESLPTAPTVAAAEKVKGLHETKRWKAEVTDKAALVAFIAANPMYLHLVTVDTAALTALARSLKDNMMLPGVKAVVEVGLTSRTK
jgi:hypothetical protein